MNLKSFMNYRGFLIMLFLLMAVCFSGFSQYSPNGMSYQAVARDNTGQLIQNKDLIVQISILSDNSSGAVEWKEEHQVKTNGFGLFTLSIGSGSKIGGSAAGISDVQWGKSAHFLKVEIDFGDGSFVHLGTTQMLAVPYALYAQKAGDSDGGLTDLTFDANTNALMNNGQVVTDLSPLKQHLIYDNVNAHLSISGSSEIVDLRDFINAPQDLRSNNDKIWLTGNKDSTIIDLSPYKQSLSIGSNSKLIISNGNSVPIDTSDLNEIQTLSRTANKISLNKNGGEVSVDDADADPANELITKLSYDQDTKVLSVQEGSNLKTVDISPKKVAFRSLKTNSMPLSPGQTATVQFPDERYDSASSFDALTGIFRVPEGGNGTYSFFFNLNWSSSDNTYLKFELLKNDQNPELLLNYNQPIILDLSENDEIKIRVTATDNATLREASFIGYKIQ